VGELRTAFTLSESIATRIRDFRIDRIFKINAGETPVPVREGGRLVLHLIPLSAFTGGSVIDIQKHNDQLHRFVPFRASGWNNRMNIDGYVNFTGGLPEPSRAYTQLYRSGIVEAVEGLNSYEGKQCISPSYEKEVLDVLGSYLKMLEQFNIQPPIYIFLSFVGVKNSQLVTERDYFRRFEQHGLDRDVLLLPEVVIDNFGVDLVSMLRPQFDLVWNAYGYLRSFNFDDAGKWTGQG
jgi:hypothetical protein